MVGRSAEGDGGRIIGSAGYCRAGSGLDTADNSRLGRSSTHPGELDRQTPKLIFVGFAAVGAGAGRKRQRGRSAKGW